MGNMHGKGTKLIQAKRKDVYQESEKWSDPTLCTECQLERIMAIKDGKDGTIVTTTGIHIARRIGESLARAYNGDFSFQYADDEKSIRVYWQRD